MVKLLDPITGKVVWDSEAPVTGPMEPPRAGGDLVRSGDFPQAVAAQKGDIVDYLRSMEGRR